MSFCIILLLWTDTATELVLTTLGYSLVQFGVEERSG